MPKIQLVQSRLQAPSTTGQRFIQADTRVAEAIQGAGQLFQQAAERRLEKQANTSIYEMKDELQKMSLDSYVDVQKTKLGKNALPDEESGYAGVYEDYNQTADKFISERISSLPAKYQQAAKERLTDVSNGYRTRFAIFQSAQESEHRKGVLAKSVGNIKAELYLDMSGGGGVDRIDEGYAELKKIVKDESGGKDVSVFLEQTKADLYKQSILAKSENYPHAALEMLKEPSVKKALDPGQRKTLEEIIDRGRVEKDVADANAIIDAAPVNDASKREMAMEASDDPEVQKRVVAHVNTRLAQEERIEVDKRSDLIDLLQESLLEKKEIMDPDTVYSNPTYDILSPGEKAMVYKWAGGGVGARAGEMDTLQRERTYDIAKQKIISGEWDEYELKKRQGADYDVRDKRGLVTMAQERENTIVMSNAVDFELKSLYQDVYDDPELRRKTIKGVDLDTGEYRKINKKDPDRDAIKKMVKDNAEGFAKISFWRSEEEKALEEAYPTIGDPQYEYLDIDADGRVSYSEREVLRYRKSYPSAAYRSSRNVYDLGEQKESNGLYYFIHEGELKSFPVEDKSQYDGYQRWLIEEGGK